MTTSDFCPFSLSQTCIGPIRTNGYYEVLSNEFPQGEYQDSPFVKDLYDRNCSWARNPLGVLVKDHDGLVIFVPPRSDIIEKEQERLHRRQLEENDYRFVPRNPPLDDPHERDIRENPYFEFLNHHQYAPQSSADQDLSRVVNAWLNNIFHSPSQRELDEEAKRLRDYNIALMETLFAPSESLIKQRKKEQLNILKEYEVEKLLKNSSLDTNSLSSEQLIELYEVRNTTHQLFSVVNQLDLWDNYPHLSEIDCIYDEEVVKSSEWFEGFIQELIDFDHQLPSNIELPNKDNLLLAFRKGLQNLGNREQHYQALADLFFEGNLQIKSEEFWEKRFNSAKKCLDDLIDISKEHIPTSSEDLQTCLKNGIMGFLNGVVTSSNDPLMQPLYKPIKMITGELCKHPVSAEQESSWTYQTTHFGTELFMGGVAWGVGFKLLKSLKPAVHYAWMNKAALKEALNSKVLTDNFLSRAGLISKQTNQVKFDVEYLKHVYQPSATCFYDVMSALQKQGTKGYPACVKEFTRIRTVRNYCIEKSLSTEKTAQIMKVKTLHLETHHILSPRNLQKGWTRRFNNIVRKYGLDLEGEWNKIQIPHKGRHPDVYHRFFYDKVVKIDKVANGNQEKFLKLFEKEVKTILEENPLLVRGIGI